MSDIQKIKARCGYAGKPQQWQYGFDLAIRELQAANTKDVPEGFVLLPKELTQDVNNVLGYPSFSFISAAEVYRKLGFEIPRKAEEEQAFFLHKLLILALEHGSKFLEVFHAETQAMLNAQMPPKTEQVKGCE